MNNSLMWGEWEATHVVMVGICGGGFGGSLFILENPRYIV
tara:strand:+ start:866 stop:985 length:120 start_codon:yes stop_codon:yes gene_type:complete